MLIGFDDAGTGTWDVCILGAGPAGISLALALTAKNRRVLLCEAGGFEVTAQSQDSYRGETIGDPYYDLEFSRLRYFGGTSGHWGGACRPLDAIDFAFKPYKPKAYWPIGKKDLDPHAVRACELLKIEPFPPNQTIDDSELQRWQLHWSPPIQFGDRYRDEVLGAANIGLLLEANALRLSTAEGRITSVELVDYAERRTFASARAFVVAMGGIENSRFLLWNNTISRGAVIPNPDTLGKYWMEHPIASYGQILLYSRSPEVLKFNLQPARQLELGALNAGLSMSSLTPLGGDAPIRELLMDLACNAPTLANWLRQQVQGRDLCTAGGFVYWEQEPRADNRIELHASAVDRFGIPRPVLHWRKSEYDFDSVRKTVIEFGRYLVAANLGRLKIDEWVLRGGPLPDTGSFAEQYGGHHHMGGTRMAASPSDGVVDADLRVHGRENLYVLGSSSFPSSGHANPTFTIVQLALRLADHLTTKA